MNIKILKVKRLIMKTSGPIAGSLMLALAFWPTPAFAATTTPSCSGASCDLIASYVNPLIDLLSIVFGLIAVISIIMGGIQYSASEGDPQKAAQAKSRISNTIIAIFAYLFLYAFLQFLIPGGAFH